MFNLLLHQTKTYYEDRGQIYLICLYQALFSSAFYGLLRVGELMSGMHPVFATDVHIGINKKKILFILYMSKTHWHDNKPQIVKIKNNGKQNSSRKQISTFQDCCPYEIL